MKLNNQEEYTLYAFQYTDWSIEYSFDKLRNLGDKDIKRYLIEVMTIEKMRELQALKAEHTYDIVQCLLDVNWHRAAQLRFENL